MKLIIQRVSQARVSVSNRTVGQIGPGLLVYVGFGVGDGHTHADDLCHQLLHLRLMADKHHRFNHSILDTRGEILVISQFTLYAHLQGRRPSFTQALPPQPAETLYNYFIQRLQSSGLHVASGTFGAMMQVASVNDGPVTISLTSNQPPSHDKN